jgi:glycosyltransferase involved in cell wall biosynthesis
MEGLNLVSVEPNDMSDDMSVEAAPGPTSALLVVDDGTLSRFGIVVRHLCVGMIDEAVQMAVLSRTSPSSVGEAIGPSRVISPHREWLPWARRPSAEGLLEELGGVRPRVVHCLSTELGAWAYDWAVAWNAVLVVQMADMRDVRAFGGLGSYQHLFAIAHTAVIEQALLKWHPEMAGRVTTIPVGIPSRDEIACYARPDQVPAVIVTASLEHGSGLELALKALQIIREAGQNPHLFVLSDGHAEAAFRRQLDRLKLRSMVTLAGAMHDWEAFSNAMAASDLYLMPISPERFSSCALMAMATGLAVLAPRDTIEDYLVDDQTACLFEPRVSDLAEKWMSLLKDREQARQLARGAQEYVLAYHKASFMVCAIAALYRQAVARLRQISSDEGSPAPAS